MLVVKDAGGPEEDSGNENKKFSLILIYLKDILKKDKVDLSCKRREAHEPPLRTGADNWLP